MRWNCESTQPKNTPCLNLPVAWAILPVLFLRRITRSAHPGLTMLKSQLRINPINHAREGDDRPNVFGAANPSHRTLQAQPKTRMRHAAIPAQSQVLLK